MVSFTQPGKHLIFSIKGKQRVEFQHNLCPHLHLAGSAFPTSITFTSLAIGKYEARTYKAASFVLSTGMWDAPGPQHSRTSLASE